MLHAPTIGEWIKRFQAESATLVMGLSGALFAGVSIALFSAARVEPEPGTALLWLGSTLATTYILASLWRLLHERNARSMQAPDEGVLGVRLSEVERTLAMLRETRTAGSSEEGATDREDSDIEGTHITNVRAIERELEGLRFRRNVMRPRVIHSVDLRDHSFFAPTKWLLEPNVNVILGRNGYGKSLLLKIIVSTLANDEETVSPLLLVGKGKPRLEIVLCDARDTFENIVVEHGLFRETVGQIPILAIPDLRFLERRQRSISSNEADEVDFIRNGAAAFLRDEPFNNLVQRALTDACIEFFEGDRNLDTPILTLITSVIRRLSKNDFHISRIENAGHGAFRILVTQDGQQLPLQVASQGTLSIVAILATIHQFVSRLAHDRGQKEVKDVSALVVLDELDAHLHPTWQQQILGLLRDHFPRVQFICTAHSPLVVAGCLDREVAVLRKQKYGHALEKIEHDFIGWPPEKILRDVFDVEEKDEAYLRYSALAPRRDAIEKSVEALHKKLANSGLSDAEEFRLAEMIRTLRYIDLVKRQQRQEIEEDRSKALGEKAVAEELRADPDRTWKRGPES